MAPSHFISQTSGPNNSAHMTPSLQTLCHRFPLRCDRTQSIQLPVKLRNEVSGTKEYHLAFSMTWFFPSQPRVQEAFLSSITIIGIHSWWCVELTPQCCLPIPASLGNSGMLYLDLKNLSKARLCFCLMLLNLKEVCLWLSVGFEGKHFLFLWDTVCQVFIYHSVIYCALFIFIFCFVSLLVA